MRFEVIDIRAGPMHFGSNRMASTVDEIIAEAFLFDEGAAYIVDFETPDFRPEAIDSITMSQAACRAPETASNTFEISSGIALPQNPVQVMS
jgi:hypothetical protein